MTTPQQAIVLIRDVFEHYRVEPAAPMPVLVERLAPIIELKTGLKISLQVVTSPGRHIKGRLLRYAKTADIHISSELNPCWQRFVACKELAHLLVDVDADAYTTNPDALIGCLLRDPWSANGEMKSERLAVLGAIEMLIPEACHAHLMAMKNAGAKHLEIADHFRVPAKMIDCRFGAYYASEMAAAYKDLEPKRD